MPPLETMDLEQTAVLWVTTGLNAEGNQVVAAQGVEIPVRWNIRRVERRDRDGKPVFYDGTVVVSQDVEIGSIMWLGTLDEVPGSAVPQVPTSDLYQVADIKKAVDLKGRHTRRELMLNRFNDVLPVS